MRHGETLWNRERRIMGALDIPLSTEGRAQCFAAAEVLGGLGLQRIVSSPQSRAVETAEIVADALGLPVQADADLEEVHFGSWQGQTYTQVAQDPLYATYASDPLRNATPGGETLLDVQQRGLRALERLRADEVVLCVSHGDILRSLLCHLLAMPLASYRTLRVDNCGLSAFRLTQGGVESKFVNYLADPKRAWDGAHWGAPA